MMLVYASGQCMVLRVFTVMAGSSRLVMPLGRAQFCGCSQWWQLSCLEWRWS